jgi:hypothetical protein
MGTELLSSEEKLDIQSDEGNQDDESDTKKHGTGNRMSTLL